MSERKALKLALEVLEDRSSLVKWQMARDAVKEALAQPEPTSIGKSIANEEAYWRDEMLSGD